MDERGCVNEIAAGLGNLGIVPGDTILVHSSLKSLGPVPGGIETVIQGLLRAVGSGGTLLVPALSWALRPPEAFDPRLTLSNIGAIPEYFRTREGTTRSIHPTHSVCGIGKRTRELLDDHWRDATPCGPQSPFRKITESDAKIVMLGCGLRPNTTMHALEEQVEPPYLFGPSCVFTITDWTGKTYQKEYRTHGFAGCMQRYDRAAEFGAAGFIRRGKVLQAETAVLDAPGLRSAVLSKLRENPLHFVDRMPAAR